MKKLLSVLFAVLLVIGLTGCSGSEQEEETIVEENTSTWVYEGVGYDALYESLGKVDLDLSDADGLLKEILEKGEIVMATSPDYPPMEFPDMVTGEIKGADVLLAKYIANSLGVELKIESMEFGAVITSIDTGKADIALSGLGYKEDRAENYEMSHGYQSDSSAAHHTILVAADKLDEYNSLADFAGKTVYAQANSLQEGYVQKQLVEVYGTTMELYQDINVALTELYNGTIEAIAFDSTTAINYANTSGGKLASLYVEKGIEFDLSAEEMYSGNVCLVKKGETSLINAINTIIDAMLETDLYQQMYYAACDASGVDPTTEE